MNKQELNRFIDKISPTGPGGVEKIKRVLKEVLDKGEKGITEEELIEALTTKQDTIQDLSEIRSGAALGSTAYQKPSAGIPASDMTTAVQNSLELANSSVQAEPIGSIIPPANPSQFATKEEVSQLGQKITDKAKDIIDFEGITTESVAPTSNTTGGYSPSGEAITTSLRTYWYPVTPGELYKITIGNFSSQGFSVVNLWNGSSFITSAINSPTTGSYDAYIYIPNGCNKIGVTYFTNNVVKCTALTQKLQEDLSTLQGVVAGIVPSTDVLIANIEPTKNLWKNGDVSFSGASATYLVGQEGVTLFPAGEYILSANYINTLNTVNIRFYGASGLLLLVSQIAGDGKRYAYPISVAEDVERVLFSFQAAGDANSATFWDIQLENKLNWFGYSSSPSKGDWVNLPYGSTYLEENEALRDVIARSFATSHWAGKKINYNGDSITQGIGTLRTGYVKVVNQLLNFGVVRNYAIGGTRLAHTTDEVNCMVDRISDMDTDADIIFIMANTNDYASQIPIGTSDSADISTYKGALNTIFNWLRTTYPTQPIIISTMLRRKVNYDGGGQPLPITIEQYAEAVRERTLAYGFILYDAYNLSGMDFRTTPIDGTGVSDDRLHPNEAGAQALGRKIAAFINAQ